jgi:hypothetical protein
MQFSLFCTETQRKQNRRGEAGKVQGNFAGGVSRLLFAALPLGECEF